MMATARILPFLHGHPRQKRTLPDIESMNVAVESSRIVIPVPPDPISAPHLVVPCTQLGDEDCAVPDASNPSDSGYVSTSSSANTGPKEAPLGIPGLQTIPQRSRLQSWKHVKLRSYSKEIPKNTLEHFLDLKELFGKALYDHVNKSKFPNGSISIKLKMLGEYEATAKPWIVILCDKNLAKSVRKFFRRDWVRQECQPKASDTERPCLDVVVYEIPPLILAGCRKVRSKPRNATTPSFGLCGRTIEVNDGGKSRIATLGGLVKVHYAQDEISIFAMTASHVLEDEEFNPWNGQSTGPHASDGDEITDSLDGDSDLSSTDSEDEGYFELELDESADSPKLNDPIPTVAEDIDSASDWGKVISTSHDTDWALIECETIFDYQLGFRYAGGSYKELQSCEAPVRDLSDTFPRRIFMITGMNGYVQGKITSASLSMLPGSKKLVEVYDLTIDAAHGPSKLTHGDSGSWVIDRITYEVYGHVVASDVFGEVSVVPLSLSLQSMACHFKAESVGLPNLADLCQWISNKTKPFPTCSTYPGCCDYKIPACTRCERDGRAYACSNQEYIETIIGNEKLPEDPSIPKDQTILWTATVNARRPSKTPSATALAMGTLSHLYQSPVEQPNIGTRCDRVACMMQYERLSDLKRDLDTIHFSTKYYWCPVPTCYRSNTGTGNKPFTRKDKCAEHVHKVHKDSRINLAAFDFGVENSLLPSLSSLTSTTDAPGLTSYENQYTVAKPLQMEIDAETSIFPSHIIHDSTCPLSVNLHNMEPFPGQMGPFTEQKNGAAMSTAFSGTGAIPQTIFDTNVFLESIPASQIGSAASFLDGGSQASKQTCM